MKTAIVIGATGLVGRQLVMQLLDSDAYNRVKVFVRRSLGVQHRKLEEHLTNFGELSLVEQEITGDVLFSCLGTTLKQAGSKAAQFTVDYTYQYEFAKLASQNHVAHYVLVSSTSASRQSLFFYSRMKGKLEDAIKELPFLKISIIRPSVLFGKRENRRSMEEFSAKVLRFFALFLPFAKRYRSISGTEVAKAMLHISLEKHTEKTKLFELDTLHRLAEF